MRTPLAVCVMAALVSLGTPAQAQRPSLVGAWERFQLKDSVGGNIQPPSPAAFLIMSAEGFYVQTAIPKNRPKATKQLAEMTREELLSRFSDVEARWGKYSVAGDTLSRTYAASVNPNAEGEMLRFSGSASKGMS